MGGGLRQSQGVKRYHAQGESFDARVLGGGEFLEGLRHKEELRGRIKGSLPLGELVKRVSLVFHLQPEGIRRPSKTRRVAEARGTVCYFAVREFGYKGDEVGKELHLFPFFPYLS